MYQSATGLFTLTLDQKVCPHQFPPSYFFIGQKGMQLYAKGIEKIHKKGFGKCRESGTLRIKSPDVETVFAPVTGTIL